MMIVSKLIAALLILAAITAQASTGQMVGCDTSKAGDHQHMTQTHTPSQNGAMDMDSPCMDSAQAEGCFIGDCACVHAGFYQAAILAHATSINHPLLTKSNFHFASTLDDTLLSYLFRPPILASIR